MYPLDAPSVNTHVFDWWATRLINLVSAGIITYADEDSDYVPEHKALALVSHYDTDEGWTE